MKSYFDDKHQWSESALEVVRKLDVFLKNIYKEETAKGYSPRELTSIVLSASSLAECKTVVDLQKAIREAKKNEV